MQHATAGPRFFSEDEIRRNLTFEALIPALRRALVDFSAGRVTQPVRTVLRVDPHAGWFATMPAVTPDVFGAKLVTFFPGNAGKRHTHNAMIQLFHIETGEPLAVLDGRLITEMRTAAVSAIATDLLAPKTTPVLAILGSGVQARSHLSALRLVRHFDEVRVWSSTRANAARFAEETGATLADSAELAVRGASVVVTVTSAAEPVLCGEWLAPDTHVNAVGSCTPDRRELDNLAMAGRVVVESRASAMKESGDILLSGAPIFAELGELMADAPDPGRRFIFKSLGIAVEDLTAAWLVYSNFLQRA